MISEQRIIELAEKCDLLFVGGNTEDKVLRFANALQAEWIKSLGEPMGYWRQGIDLDESDYYPTADFPDLDTTGCIALYALPNDEEEPE